MANVVVNQSFKPVIKRVGKEGTPVIIIDDFVTDTAEILAHARQQSFTKDKSYYPGVRATLPKEYIVSILKNVCKGIQKIYKLPTHLKIKVAPSYFSLISTPETDLELLQCIPHFDTPEPYYFAVLHYLSDGEHGGTGLFRHKITGFERIFEPKVAPYLTSTEDYINTHRKPDKKYPTSSTDIFELYEEIAYKPNRLVIYPGNLLHSTIVNVFNDIDDNPRTGRLTANIFIDFK